MNAPAPIILHIAAAAAWDEAVRRGVYSADSLAAEGFIHCSDARQLVAVANRLFRGRTDLVLLRVDASKLDAPVRYENLEGGTELFPHVYGPLPTSAVVEAVSFLPDGDGGFHDGPLRDLLDAGARPRRDPSTLARSPMTSDEELLRQMAHDIAAAIGRRDADWLAGLLAPGFVYRGDAGTTTSDADAFLAGIRSIPGEIAFVRLERVVVDAAGDSALVLGVQHAQVTIDGRAVDDRRGFADLFVRIDGAWKLRAGSDFPMA